MKCLKVISHFRSLPWIALMLVSLIAAVVLVAARIPTRQIADRTAYEAYIPMRSLTPTEVAVIFDWSKSPHDKTAREIISTSQHLLKDNHYGCDACFAFVQLDEKYVWLATNQYVLPFEPQGAERNAASDVDYKGKSYNVISATWENYHLLYKLDRLEIESELGITIMPEHIQPGLKTVLKYSFSSEAIYWYALNEVLYISCLLFVVSFAIQRTLNPLILLPLWLAAVAVTASVTAWYSPAFFDADLFHQRIVIEDIFTVLTYSLYLLWPPAVIALFVLPFYLIWKAVRRFKLCSWRSYWGTLSAMCFVVTLELAWPEYQQYRVEKLEAQMILSELQTRLTTEPVQQISRDLGWTPAISSLLETDRLEVATKSEIKELFESFVNISPRDISVLIPTDGETFIFLWDTHAFRYADVRHIKNGGIEIIGYEAYSTMIKSKRSYSGSFYEFVSGDFVEGSLVLENNGAIRALLLVKQSHTGCVTSLGRAVWGILSGWFCTEIKFQSVVSTKARMLNSPISIGIDRWRIELPSVIGNN